MGWFRYSVFVAESDLKGGQSWAARIQDAVRRCEALVVLCSPTYGDTQWTFRELQLADNHRKPIVPVWHSGPFPPPSVEIFLSGSQRVPAGNRSVLELNAADAAAGGGCAGIDATFKELHECLRLLEVHPLVEAEHGGLQ